MTLMRAHYFYFANKEIQIWGGQVPSQDPTSNKWEHQIPFQEYLIPKPTTEIKYYTIFSLPRQPSYKPAE